MGGTGMMVASKWAKWRRPAWLRIDEEASPKDYLVQSRWLKFGFAFAGVAIVVGVVLQFLRPAVMGFKASEEDLRQVTGLIDLAVQAAVYLALFIPLARGVGLIFAGLPIFGAMGLDIGYRLLARAEPPWLAYAIAVLVILNALIAALWAKQAETARRDRQKQQLEDAQKVALNTPAPAPTPSVIVDAQTGAAGQPPQSCLDRQKRRALESRRPSGIILVGSLALASAAFVAGRISRR